jgi:hypothetical protein
MPTTSPTTHGKRYTKEYKIWSDLKSRCNNPNHKQYKDYGGRGIIISKEWNNFINFYTDMGDCPTNHSIDRIDNNLGYNKDNCKWSTKKEQTRNRRNTIIVTYKDETKPLAVFCEQLGLNYDTVRQRLFKQKWSIEEAFNKASIFVSNPIL